MSYELNHVYFFLFLFVCTPVNDCCMIYHLACVCCLKGFTVLPSSWHWWCTDSNGIDNDSRMMTLFDNFNQVFFESLHFFVLFVNMT